MGYKHIHVVVRYAIGKSSAISLRKITAQNITAIESFSGSWKRSKLVRISLASSLMKEVLILLLIKNLR